MNILVVDDSKHVQALVEEMLKKAGMTACKAYDGKEALSVIKEKKDGIELVLLDWNMPVMNGPEFLEAYRDQELSSAPVVMMTTENSIDHITKAMELGASEYIMKPFTEDILISKINFVMGQNKGKNVG